MKMKSSICALSGILLVSGLLLGSAWAQSAPGPLNLKLPPSDVLAAASTAPMPASASSVGSGKAASVADAGNSGTGKNGSAGIARPPASGTAMTNVKAAPGVYYGDTSGHMSSADVVNAPTCDDSKYNEPQVHGSLSTGIASGSHMGTSSYSGGEVNVTKAFGDCDHPSGGISISIGGATNNFNDNQRYRRSY